MPAAGTTTPTRIGIIAPFALDYLIEPRIVHTDGRGAAGRSIASHMAESPVWCSTDASDAARYRDFEPGLGERLRDASPDWIATGDGATFARRLRRSDAGLAQLAATMAARPMRLELTGADIAISEFGFGATMLTYAVATADHDAAPDGELCDYTLGLNVLDRLTDPLQEALDDFDDRLPPELKLVLEGGGMHRAERGRCLWNHNLVGYDAVPNDRDAAAAELADLSPSLDPEGRVPLAIGRSALVPGLGTSVLVGHADDWDRAIRTFGLAQAYYAATASTERALVSMTASARRDEGHRAGGQRRLEGMHDRIEVAGLFAQSFTVMDAHLAASTIEETRAWDGIRHQWGADKLLHKIEDHLQDLIIASRHLHDELGAERQRRLNDAAFVFASLAVISTIFDFLDFNQGESLVTPVVDRLILSVLVLVMLVSGLVYLSRRRA